MNGVNLFLFRTWLIVISTLFLLNLTCCQNEKPTKHIVEQQRINNALLEKSLCSKYDTNFLADSAQFFTYGYQKELLTKTVLLDSIVHSIVKDGDNYFLTAEVKSDETTRIFARLKLTEEIFNSYSITDSTSVILAVNLNSIKKEAGILEGDDALSNSGISFHIYDILLEGECIEIIPRGTLLVTESLG